jgi:signal transduction histidine kinase
MTRRIFLTILGVAVIAVVLFGVPLAIAVERRNASDAVLELQRTAGAAASQIPDGFASASVSVTLPTVEPSMQLALYDIAGHLVAGSGPVEADPVVRAVADGAVHDGRVGDDLVVVVPVVHDETITGALRSSEPADEATDRTQRTWLAMAGLAAIVAIIAGIAGSLLARHLTRPVQRLRDAAIRLGEGDFTATPPTSGLPELDAAASALSATGQRLGGLVERERAFSADASHQLRTPLASLRLALESELVQPRADPTVALRDALADVDRLEATLTDLLALARDTPSDRRPVDLAVLLGVVDSTWRGRLAVTGRALRISIDDGTPSVLISATALSTVIDVLVENAIRHGRGTVTVEAGRARGGGAAIMISDEGHLRSDPETIFQRRSTQATGHGIGLALARSLAHAEGARLQLSRSNPTTFEVIIAAAVSARPSESIVS